MVPEASFVIATFATPEGAQAALAEGRVEYSPARVLGIANISPAAFAPSIPERRDGRSRKRQPADEGPEAPGSA